MKKLIVIFLMMFLIIGCAKDNDVKHILVDKISDVELTQEELTKISNIIEVLPEETKYSIKDASNQDKLYFAFSLLRLENTDLENHTIKPYNTNKQTITDAIKKYFGNSIEVTMEDYKCRDCQNNILYTYDSLSESFKETYHGHGTFEAMQAKAIISTKKRGNQYLIEVVKVYAGPVSDIYFEYPTKLYKSETDAFRDENMVLDIKNNADYCAYDASQDWVTCDLEKVAVNEKELFNTYTYIFNIENNLPVFVEFKIN